MFPDWFESFCSFLFRCYLKKFPISGATSLSRCSLTASSMLLKLCSSSFGVLFNSMAAAFRWSFKTLLSSGVISFLYLASLSFSHMPPISSNTHCVSEMLPLLSITNRQRNIIVKRPSTIKQEMLKKLLIMHIWHMDIMFTQ